MSLTWERSHLSIRNSVRPDSAARPHPGSENSAMSLRDSLSKQFIDVIEWVEPQDGILAYRYPMQDREIQNGGKLTVRASQMAVFVNEGNIADIFGPGLYTLNTHTL